MLVFAALCLAMPADTVIVVPCYNEAARLDIGQFVALCRESPAIRFVFVDDGSTDQTLQILRAAQRDHPADVDVLALSRNAGKAEAVRQGFLKVLDEHDARIAYVGFWDADLATPLTDILVFRRRLVDMPHIQIVFGSRVNLLGRNVKRDILRHYIGRVFATMAVAALDVPIYDTQCGAKMFRANADTRALFAEPFLSRWIFDVEIVARLDRQRCGSDLPRARDVIYEHPLEVWRDVKGSKIKYSDFVQVGKDLFRIWWRYSMKAPK